MSWNEDLFRFINHDMANPGLDVLFAFFIIVGTIYVWLLLVPVLWFKKRRIEAADLFLLILVVALITTILKFIVAAPRPADIREFPLPVPAYFGYDLYSFPSSQASRAFACALFLSFRFKKWTIPLFVLAFLIAIAKIYVGAHYPVDVIVGAILGTVLGLLFVVMDQYPPYANRRVEFVLKIRALGRRFFRKV